MMAFLKLMEARLLFFKKGGILSSHSISFTFTRKKRKPTLETNKDTVGNDTLGLLDHIESNEGNLHGQDGTENVEGCISNIQTVGITA